ncbi:hypothetical protein M3Y99_01488100 [Aphelenchoides fujianensis]|nr:hypothetical protein M3Y99_01488100 [Aphelenchoides fujianensis]
MTEFYRFSLVDPARSEIVKCPQIGDFLWPGCPWVLAEGIFCMHPVHRTFVKRRLINEFHSYRIPIDRPESLGYLAWFEVLRFDHQEIDVLQRGACRPLSPSGFYLNKILFLSPHRIFIRPDVDLPPRPRTRLQPLSRPLQASRLVSGLPPIDHEADREEEELQRAILESLRLAREQQEGPLGSLEQESSSEEQEAGCSTSQAHAESSTWKNKLQRFFGRGKRK